MHSTLATRRGSRCSTMLCVCVRVCPASSCIWGPVCPWPGHGTASLGLPRPPWAYWDCPALMTRWHGMTWFPIRAAACLVSMSASTARTWTQRMLSEATMHTITPVHTTYTHGRPCRDLLAIVCFGGLKGVHVSDYFVHHLHAGCRAQVAGCHSIVPNACMVHSLSLSLVHRYWR